MLYLLSLLLTTIGCWLIATSLLASVGVVIAVDFFINEDMKNGQYCISRRPAGYRFILLLIQFIVVTTVLQLAKVSDEVMTRNSAMTTTLRLGNGIVDDLENKGAEDGWDVPAKATLKFGRRKMEMSFRMA